MQNINRNKVLANITVLVITLLLCLIFFEFLLRFSGMVVVPSKISKYRISDPILHHALRPNSKGIHTTPEWVVEYNINSLGLRGKEISNEKTKTRVLVLGDSMTEGYGVNDNQTIPARIDHYLNQVGEFNVINGGVASYSPTVEYLFLKEKGLSLNPDIIILLFDLSDIRDDFHFQKVSVFNDKGELIALPPTDVKLSLSEKINRFFYSGSAISLLLGRSIKRISGVYAKKDNFEIGNVGEDRWFVTRCEDEISYDYIKKHLELSLSYILKIKKLSEKNNVEFFLVLYPYGHQISSDEWPIGRKVVHLDKRPIYCTHSISLTEKFAKKQNINTINVFNDLVKYKKEKEVTLYNKIDMHFNAHGYDIVAKLISKKIWEEVYSKNEQK